MKKKCVEILLNGTTLSPGIAIGQAFPYRDVLTRDVSSYTIAGKDIPYELKRITNAFEEARKDLYQLSRTVSHNISSEEGTIFEAQKLMIEDKEFVRSFETEMRNALVNAEQVTKNVFRRHIERFEGSANKVIKAKADDLRDIFRKVLRSLLGIETSILCNLPENSVIVARRLLPSDTLRLDQKNVQGIIVQEGSIHAHSALLARSLGIPALSTNGTSVDTVKLGETVIIDGYTSCTIVCPAPATVQTYCEKKERSSLEAKKRMNAIRTVSRTASGKTIQIFANANTLEEVDSALKAGCDGIGLFRTENVYLQSRWIPTEDDLFEYLKQAVKPVDNRPVTIRLLDIGGDKRLPYFQFEEEFSPFLGLRGVRLLLKNPDLLKTQLRALLRLSTIRSIKILIPMVSIPEEIVEVRHYVNECREELGSVLQAGSLELGSMVETPSSALAIEELVSVSDFISIGTNDLVQYIMAASRENPNVAGLYEKGFEYVLPLVETIAKVCIRNNRECCVCGEMANDESFLKKFIEHGITRFSVSAFRIPHLKAYVRRLAL